MASSKAEPDRTRSSDPDRKIRIVGKIRGFTDQESESLKENADGPWISVRKASEGKVAISFRDQSTKDVYEVNNCYEQNQDNLLIFEREIKPFIPEVVGGQNVTVIAYGARGSGKTYTIQGTEENQGLASLAISEVISCIGGRGTSVAVSFYEVFQDHVYDLLDPTRPEVQVLEDAHGKVKLKGLSQGSVKSASEFQKLYPNECASLCDSKKKPPQLARRSHKGLIIRVLSNSESSSAKLLGKINFVDLAGYEDAKRMSSEGMNLAEKNRVNMSLHALLNVVYALNANETHVPYRGSKLARMLRDSLGRKSHAVMFICLNPLFCQDTIYATSLASRACQGVNRAATSSNKKSNSSIKQMAPTPVVKGRPGTVCDSMKKSTNSRATPIKKTPFLVKGRKLFDEEKHTSSAKQVKSKSKMAPVTQSMSLPDTGSIILPSPQDEVCVTQSMSLPDTGFVIPPSSQDEEKSTSITSSTQDLKEIESTADVRPTTVIENEADSSHRVSKSAEVSSLRVSNKIDPTCPEDGKTLQKENIDLPMKDSEENCTSQDMGKEKCLVENGGGSPPLSERLRDLSNYLKSLHPPTPPRLNIQHETNHSVEVASTEIEEPKTPVHEKEHGLVDKWELENIKTPSETIGTCGTGGFKESFVQEYLKVLNTADKIKLRSIPGIGEKRAKYILELREESPEPFKDLDDLKDIGLSSKQVKGMLKNLAAELFS